MKGHRGGHLVAFLRIFLPSGDDCFDLSKEVDSVLAVEVDITSDGVFVSSEGHHRQGNRNRQVDSNLTALDLSLEFPSRRSRFSEDGSSISVFVANKKRRLTLLMKFYLLMISRA